MKHAETTRSRDLTLLQDEIDRRISTARREVEMEGRAVRELFGAKSASTERGLEALAAQIAMGDETLRHHIADQIVQVQIALDSAKAGAEALGVRVVDGDAALYRHIADQVVQVETALRGAEEATRTALDVARREMDQRMEAGAKMLEVVMAERDRERLAFAQSVTSRFEAERGELSERLTAVREQLAAAASAQKEAVIKAELATEKRFDSVNEFRAQSNDRERTMAEDRALVAANYLPRETFAAQMAGLALWRESVERRLNLGDGQQQGADHLSSTNFKVGDQRIATWAIIAAAIVGVLAIVVTVALHGSFSK